MTVTNAQDWIKDITSVQAIKVWNDNLDHTSDYVTVYLSIKDPDGTVRRIREAILGEENEWNYTWTNLPKYYTDGVTPIIYLIEESYTPGYSSTVEQIEEIIISNYSWKEAANFKSGEKYLLKTPNGYLSANSTSTDTFKFITEEQARAEYGTPGSLATWTATVSGNNVKLVNGCGQIITYENNNRYFRVTNDDKGNYQVFQVGTRNGAITLKNTGSNQFIAGLSSNGYLSQNNRQQNALLFTPWIREGSEQVVKVTDIAYRVINTPLNRETSLKVTKKWDVGIATGIYYEDLKITVKLFANGKDTGRTLTLSLKNGWTDTFRGLPYADENGDPIVYTVGEGAIHEDWEPIYGEVITIPGTTPTYETTVTNSYRYGHGYELPATGGLGGATLILCGLALMAGSLVCGYVITRKRERRRRE